MKKEDKMMEEVIKEEMKKEATLEGVIKMEETEMMEEEASTNARSIVSIGIEAIVPLAANADFHTRNLQNASTKTDVTGKKSVDFSILICTEEMMAIF